MMYELPSKKRGVLGCQKCLSYNILFIMESNYELSTWAFWDTIENHHARQEMYL